MKPSQPQFEAAQRFLHGLLESATDGHGLAHRLHLSGQPGIRPRELLEGETRDLGDHVIDGGLERRRRTATGDLVLELIQGVAHRQLGGDFRDGEAGGFGSQRRRARDARVHFNDEHAAVFWAYGKLHVGAAGIHANFAQHRDRSIAQTLVLAVRQRLRRRDRNGVAGMHPHRVEVLDGAHDNAIIIAVPDHLHLVFFPAEHRFFEQHFIGGRGIQAARHDGLEFFAVVRDAAAATAHGEGRANDGGKTDLSLDRQGLFHAVRNARASGFEPDVRHGLAE